ncbi:MAG: FAD binding domain-containing protein [Acidimicrobiia bacterium]|nr:FAD binding domain-containing protein [Acidimicrobiia bacterium]
MKRLREFAYFEPVTLEDATAILVAGGSGARVIAGGTDLVVDMKTGRLRPSSVVNIKRIEGLAGIEAADGGIRIGALTKASAIQASTLIGERVRALADAASVLASPPVRALATIGGNVGRASPASDLGPALIVHQAIATIVGPDGSRDETVESLYVGPGTTTLAAHDILVSFFIPDAAPGTGSAHLKIGTRASGTDIAMVGVSAAVTVGPANTINAARIALASVAPTPMRAARAEAMLIGREAAEESIAAAGEAAAGECRPISDLRAGAAHRIALVRVLTMRALRIAIERAGGGA